MLIVQIYAKRNSRGFFNDLIPFRISFKVRSTNQKSYFPWQMRKYKYIFYRLELCLKRQQGLLQQSKKKLKRNPRSSRQLVWPEVQASKGEVIYHTNRNSMKISDRISPISSFFVIKLNYFHWKNLDSIWTCQIINYLRENYVLISISAGFTKFSLPTYFIGLN